MSILSNIPTTIITDEQILNGIARQIKEISRKSFFDLVEIQKNGIDMVWNNGKFTPQQVIDSLGSDAIKIFQYHAGLTDYLVAISEIDGIEYTPALPNNAFTINAQTGKITVTEDPYI